MGGGLLAAAVGLGAHALPQAAAQELVYGSCVPASDILTSNALPAGFKVIEEETKGAIKWKVMPGGQIADCKATFSAVKDELMQGGLGIPTYVPNLLPSNAMLYSTVIPGDDVVAAAGAGSESLLLNCPSCLEEYKQLNTIPLSPYPGAASVFMCIKPVKTVEDLKGKRIRAHRRSGGAREARRRHPRQGDADRDGGHAAARRHRLHLRSARVAQDLQLRRRCQVRGGLSARRAVAGRRLPDQPRHLPQADA